MTGVTNRFCFRATFDESRTRCTWPIRLQRSSVYINPCFKHGEKLHRPEDWEQFEGNPVSGPWGFPTGLDDEPAPCFYAAVRSFGCTAIELLGFADYCILEMKCPRHPALGQARLYAVAIILWMLLSRISHPRFQPTLETSKIKQNKAFILLNLKKARLILFK